MTNNDDNTHIDYDEGKCMLQRGKCHLSSQHILTFTYVHHLNQMDDDEFQLALLCSPL